MVFHRLFAVPLRTLLGLFAVAALVGACSSGGDDESSDTTTTEADDEDTTSTTDGSTEGGDEVCSFFDPADLEAETGLPFEEQEPGENSCTYISSTGAAIAVNVVDVSADPVSGLQGAQSTCEEGTVEEITITEADSAFTCLVTGIPTVAAVGSGVLIVLTGADADEEVDDATFTTALVNILESASSSG